MAASSIRSASSFGGSSDDVLMASGEDAPGIPTVETSALVDASGPGAADDGTRSTVVGLESVTVAGGSVNDRIVMGALDDTLSARGADVVTTAGGEDVH